MGALRDRMVRDMQLRRLVPSTQEAYARAVWGLAAFYRRPPDQLGSEEVKSYLLRLMNERGPNWGTVNIACSAIRFFFSQTLGRSDVSGSIPPRRTPRRLPEVLSGEEVVRLFAVTANVKHRALLMTAYAAGLRAARHRGLPHAGPRRPPRAVRHLRLRAPRLQLLPQSPSPSPSSSDASSSTCSPRDTPASATSASCPAGPRPATSPDAANGWARRPPPSATGPSYPPYTSCVPPFPIVCHPTPASGIAQCDLIGNAHALPIRPSSLWITSAPLRVIHNGRFGQ